MNLFERRRIAFCRSLLLMSLVPCMVFSKEEYMVGTGKADITGPVADVNMMGYANPEQIAGGIHTRLYARAFIVSDASNDTSRVVFVNLDACMASQAVTFTVLDKLKRLYGDLYTERNVALSGTHTHSGPAGYLQYLVYDVTGLGFVQQTFDALVEGIVLSIVRAHESLKPGRLTVGSGLLLDANINRSPTAYVMNPEEERGLYEYDIDKEMTLVRLEDDSGRGIGAFSWFPVHGTSMNNTNTLINGDNKGAASLFMEKEMGNDFVAGFCQANVGDTSPNTFGPFCMDTGLPCDAVHSTCNGRVQQCVGRGPGWPDHFESTRIIAEKQYRKATELFKNVETPVSGPIESSHMFLDMRNIQVEETEYTRAGRSCKPAMGFSFAAGTTDGPGAFDFKQSDTNGTAFWRLVRNFITTPTKDQEECHKPKPILLDVGEMHFPYEWAPYIVEIQILRIGNFVILAVPGEFTTMSGRRLLRAVKAEVGAAWGQDVTYVIAGLTNTYSSYITTYEEYQVQRYEGGFTLFGPHTLDVYIQEFRKLAKCMLENQQQCVGGPRPPNLLPDQWSLVPGVLIDATPLGTHFGDISSMEPKQEYVIGETVKVEFHSACPRNDMRMEGTYLTVEKQASMSTWKMLLHNMLTMFRLHTLRAEAVWEVVLTDADWDTKYRWSRRESLSPFSYATIEWTIGKNTESGIYRIRHFGNYKNILGNIEAFEGSSKPFTVKRKN